MRDIGDWAEACQGAGDSFARLHALGFVLYSVEHGPLIPVDTSVGATLNRQLLPTAASARSITPKTMYKVWSLGGQDALIGSDKACDVTINDESISAQHARVFLKEGALTIIDVGSTLGTQVNRASLAPNEEREVPSGASITLGSVELKYLSAEAFPPFVNGLLSGS